MAEYKLSDFRREYLAGELLENRLLEDPYQQFMDWMEDAIRSGIEDPTAMSLATSTLSGRPSVRIVLLKDARPDAYVFFSHYLSRKGSEIEENPHAAIMFFWPGLDRQLRIEGTINKTSSVESDEFYESRTLNSRITSIISPQSEIIPDRAYLEKKFREMHSDNNNSHPHRPVNWGGYILIPETYEFWQGRENRLNDRIQYVLIDGSWEIKRLAP